MFKASESSSKLDDKAAADRMAELKTLMGDRHSEYWRGPKADVLQQEYRDLFEAGERDKTRRERVAFAPEGAPTPVPSGFNADERPDIEDSAVADRMAEIQGLMADALQQEYRDLIERRDRNKRRDEELSIF